MNTIYIFLDSYYHYYYYFPYTLINIIIGRPAEAGDLYLI